MQGELEERQTERKRKPADCIFFCSSFIGVHYRHVMQEVAVKISIAMLDCLELYMRKSHHKVTSNMKICNNSGGHRNVAYRFFK